MSYDFYETSDKQGQPIELYEFIQGESSYCYTTYHEDITFNTKVYRPSSISRDKVKQTTDSFKNDINVKFKRTDDFALSFITLTPENITTLTVYRGHVGDVDSDGVIDFKAYWKGRVLGGEVDNNTINLVCESVFTSLRRLGIRARYQYGCRHSLYSTGCGVNKDSFSNSGVIESISTNGTVLTISEASSQEDGYYSGGFIVVNNVKKFIVNHTGSSIEIMNPFPFAVASRTANFYAGCDRSKTTCEQKFNNVINFGGFPYIPSKNPFVTSPY